MQHITPGNCSPWTQAQGQPLALPLLQKREALPGSSLHPRTPLMQMKQQHGGSE